MNTLPDKPSDLIRLALRDLALCEADDRYVIDMKSWHKPLGDGQCAVCFAGAVMARELRAQVDDEVCPTDFRDEVSEKLDFLDDVTDSFLDAGRFGAFDADYCPDVERARRRKIATGVRQRLPRGPTRYADSRDDFKRDMEVVAAVFEEHGM